MSEDAETLARRQLKNQLYQRKQAGTLTKNPNQEFFDFFASKVSIINSKAASILAAATVYTLLPLAPVVPPAIAAYPNPMPKYPDLTIANPKYPIWYGFAQTIDNHLSSVASKLSAVVADNSTGKYYTDINCGKVDMDMTNPNGPPGLGSGVAIGEAAANLQEELLLTKEDWLLGILGSATDYNTDVPTRRDVITTAINKCISDLDAFVFADTVIKKDAFVHIFDQILAIDSSFYAVLCPKEVSRYKEACKLLQANQLLDLVADGHSILKNVKVNQIK